MIQARTSPAEVARPWLVELDRQLVGCDYCGPDPYDALASPRLESLRWALGRRLVVQANKRSPVDVRPLLAIPQLRMAKTLGLVAGSLAIANDLPSAATRLPQLANDLAEAQLTDGGWGYEFDVQMRWGSYPKTNSNVVATAFVVEGMTRAEIALPRVAELRSFLIDGLGRGDYFAYAAGSSALIHNANLLGAVTLQTVEPGHSLIRRAIDTTVRAQRADGTWPYGSDGSTQWVDSFHTVYVLQCLRLLRSHYDGLDIAYQRGLDAWLAEGFDSAGSPKYYLGGGPAQVDLHNIATSLSFLCELVDSDHRARPLVASTLDAIATTRRVDGTFSRRRRGAPYTRWESAHLHRALALAAQLQPEDP